MTANQEASSSTDKARLLTDHREARRAAQTIALAFMDDPTIVFAFGAILPDRKRYERVVHAYFEGTL